MNLKQNSRGFCAIPRSRSQSYANGPSSNSSVQHGGAANCNPAAARSRTPLPPRRVRGGRDDGGEDAPVSGECARAPSLSLLRGTRGRTHHAAWADNDDSFSPSPPRPAQELKEFQRKDIAEQEGIELSPNETNIFHWTATLRVSPPSHEWHHPVRCAFVLTRHRPVLRVRRAPRTLATREATSSSTSMCRITTPWVRRACVS